MGNAREIKITVSITTRFKWWRSLYVFGVFTGLIGLGVVVDSTAMQWAGFLVVCLLGIITAHNRSKLSNSVSIEQAREYLDMLERGDV